MFETLPKTTDEFINWSWAQVQPYVDDLTARPVSADWMRDWTHLHDLLNECETRLRLTMNGDTNNEAAVQRYQAFVQQIAPQHAAMNNTMTERYLASDLHIPGMEEPRRTLEADARIFREANLPLISETSVVFTQYSKIVGAQTVEWDGEEKTLLQAGLTLAEPDRSRREAVWQQMAARQVADAPRLNEVWTQLVDLRRQIAENADLPDYRAYAWLNRHRFDYTPQDCATFHDAIEQVVVPAANRLYEKRRQRLGVDTLREYDLEVDPSGKPPLQPFKTVGELVSRVIHIFHDVDPVLGQYFASMRLEDLLDLDNRKGKAPGANCNDLSARRLPFIFMNVVGKHEDIITLLHEAGHAFHLFECGKLPYHPQLEIGMEFLEVPSQAMELLAFPYLHKDKSRAGFYDTPDHARALIKLLEKIILFWPYMAVVDAFQHWVYTQAEEATHAENCNRVWGDLVDRFMPGIDFTGYEDYKVTGWHRKRHIFRAPFYYIEYGMAYLGAVQIWQNALRDQAAAVAAYRRSLALGGTVPLPELYQAAGAKFAFDVETIRNVVDFLEAQIAHHETLV